MNIQCTSTVGKNDVETYIYWIFGENLVMAITNSKSWKSINHIFANLIELEGISNEDLDAKTYFIPWTT